MKQRCLLTTHARARAWAVAQVQSLASLAAISALSCKAAAIVDGMTGVQVCAVSEAELFRRVQAQVPGDEGALLAKQVHTALWTLIVDAKTRGRRQV